MNTVSAIGSITALTQSSVSDAPTSTASWTNTSTPAAPGSGIMQYVQMFEAANAKAPADDSSAVTNQLMLSKLHVPQTPLDDGSDEENVELNFRF